MVSASRENVLHIHKFITEIYPFTPCLLVKQLRIGTVWLRPLVSICARLRRIKPKQRKCPTQIPTLSSACIVSKMLGVSNDGIAVSICINSHRRASLTFISPTSFMSYANTLPSCALPRRRVETRNCLACAHKFPYAQRPMLLIRENADRRCQPQPTILFLNPPHS